MSESMIERVARAMCASRGLDPDEEVRWLIPGTDGEEGEPYLLWEDYRQQARAALNALRVLTDDMLLKSGYRPAYADEVWQAMIDVVLEDQSQK